MDCGPPGSSVHGILHARILEWVAMPSSRGSNPRIKPTSLTPPALASRFFTTSTVWEACIYSVCVCVCVCLCVCVYLITQSYPTLCDPMDCSPSASSVHGDSLGKKTGVGCHDLLQGIFPIQRSNPGPPHCRQILYLLTKPVSYCIT